MDSRVMDEIIDEVQQLIIEGRRLSAAIVRLTEVVERQNSLSNATIERPNPTTEEIQNLLQTMNIEDQNLFRQYFDFLSSHPSYTRRLIGMPQQYRFNALQRYLNEARSS